MADETIAADERPRELLLPSWRGEMLRLAGVFPGLVARLAASAAQRGRRELERRRQAKR